MSVLVSSESRASSKRTARSRASGSTALHRARETMASSRASSAPRPAARHAAVTHARATRGVSAISNGSAPRAGASATVTRSRWSSARGRLLARVLARAMRSSGNPTSTKPPVSCLSSSVRREKPRRDTQIDPRAAPTTSRPPDPERRVEAMSSASTSPSARASSRAFAADARGGEARAAPAQTRTESTTRTITRARPSFMRAASSERRATRDSRTLRSSAPGPGQFGPAPGPSSPARTFRVSWLTGLGSVGVAFPP